MGFSEAAPDETPKACTPAVVTVSRAPTMRHACIG